MLTFPQLPLAGMVDAFWLSDLCGQTIVVLLIGGSVLAWSIMITKFIQLGRAAKAARLFLRAYHGESQPLALFLRRRQLPPNPVDAMYQAACASAVEMLSSDGAEGFLAARVETAARLTDVQVRTVRALIERTAADQALVLDSSMGALATSTTAAPFLGLLGTVIGVMNAFGAMAVSGMVVLKEVAPGISGALLTTVVGLIVALPSSIGYNFLSSKIRALTVAMENFIEEFMTDLERAHSLPAAPAAGAPDGSHSVARDRLPNVQLPL